MAAANPVQPQVPAIAQASPRDRLIDAATRLFCKYGINATGIDAIVSEAGTAKTTLYKIFGSKNDLVEAVLETEGQVWRDWFIATTNAADNPRAKLNLIFPALKQWFAGDRYYGCAFINAVGEHDKDEAKLRTLTLQHKSLVLAHIGQMARAAGAAKPDLLAHQIGILMDGAIVAAMVTRDPTVADAAAKVADTLLLEACGRPATDLRRRGSVSRIVRKLPRKAAAR